MQSMQKIRLALSACGIALTLSAGCASGPSERTQSPKPEDKGSATSVSTEQFSKQAPTSIEEWLATRVPGLEVLHLPNGEYTLRVRGATSFMAGSEPLIVLDGTPVSGGARALAGLSPQDIVKVEVLKEGGAAALYGVRGGNGVIEITTRRGR